MRPLDKRTANGTVSWMFEFIFIAALTASHLVVLGERLVEHRRFGGRSGCNHCGAELRLADVLPVVSWLMLRGRSRCCAQPVPVRYPAWETGAVLWAAIVLTLAGGVTPAAIVLGIAGIGLAFTRSYRAAVGRSTGAGVCWSHRGGVAHAGDPGVYRFLGALRCGWCARRANTREAIA